MTNEFSAYERLAMRTAKPLDHRDNLIHAALGIAGEAGELTDCFKRHLIYNQSLDRNNAIEELGDILFYIALACSALNVSMDEVAATNIAKLRKRYPSKYADDLAAFRADKQTTTEQA